MGTQLTFIGSGYQTTLKNAIRVNLFSTGTENVSSSLEALPNTRTETKPTPTEPLKYHVACTKSKNFAVYQLRKRGGNLHQTVVKKIHGSIETLQDDLTKHLEIDPKLISRKEQLGHIVIKVRGFSKRQERFRYLTYTRVTIGIASSNI